MHGCRRSMAAATCTWRDQQQQGRRYHRHQQQQQHAREPARGGRTTG